MDLLITAFLFLAALVFCLLRGFSLTWALALSFLALVCCGLRRKKSLRELWAMVRGELPGVLLVCRILCYVGLITGLWRSSGTIAFFIWWGMRIIPQKLFLLLAFLLAALLSYAIGTSFGVTSTAGVMLIALARAGGVPVPLAAGAILSGVYIGDRGAPTSSCATLQATLAGVEHYANVRHMLKTGAFPALLSLAGYAILSVRHPIVQVDQALLQALSEGFDVSWPVILPAVLMLALPAAKVPLRLCMATSAAAAFGITVFLQHVPFLEALGVALLGYDAPGLLSGVLSGGGFCSMIDTMVLLLFAGGCTGIIGGLELLRPAQDAFTRLSERVGRFPAMVLASLASAMVFCNQTIAMIFCKELMEKVYPDTPQAHQELAADLSCSVVTLAGLVPWCIACSVPLAMLGAGFNALPYAWYLYLVPLCYLCTRRCFFQNKQRRVSV